MFCVLNYILILFNPQKVYFPPIFVYFFKQQITRIFKKILKIYFFALFAQPLTIGCWIRSFVSLLRSLKMWKPVTFVSILRLLIFIKFMCSLCGAVFSVPAHV